MMRLAVHGKLMHVLLLALNYPDKLGNAPLMTGLAKDSPTWPPSDRGLRFSAPQSGRIDNEYRGKLFKGTTIEVDILRVWLSPQGGALAKMANYASLPRVPLQPRRSLMSTSFSHHHRPSPLGLSTSLFLDFDGYLSYTIPRSVSEAAIRLGVLRHPFAIKAFEALERQVYQEAHHLSVISDGFKTHCLARGVPNEKVTVIPNYTDTNFIVPSAKRGNRFRKEHGLNRKFVVQFSGRMGYSQGLETVVDAWSQLQDLPDIRLMLVGEGLARAMLEDALSVDPRVVLLPVQPRSELPCLLAAADVSLAPLRLGMAGTSVPSKIFGIMASARPVIAGVDHGSDAKNDSDSSMWFSGSAGKRMISHQPYVTYTTIVRRRGIRAVRPPICR